MSEILKKIEDEAKTMISKEVYARVDEVENNTKKSIEEFRSDMEDFQEVIDETAESMEELKKTTAEQNTQLKQAILEAKKEAKADTKQTEEKVMTEINKVDEKLSSEIKAVKEEIKDYDDAELKKELGKKADKKHKHDIKDVNGLTETIEILKDQFATKEELNNIPKGPVSVGGYTKGVRSIVAGTNVTVDNTDPRHPIVSATGGGGGSVESVTGTAVDNTDPANPVINLQDLSGYVPYTGASTDVNLGIHMLLAPTRRATTSAGLLIESANGTDVGLFGVGNTANVEWYGSHNFATATQDTIAIFSGAGKTLSSASTATYPSLTELSYVKGVTSAIQTQLNAFANGMIYKGNRDASAGTFPGAGVAQTGRFYTVSIAGTVDSVVFNVGDRLIATTDNASTTTYASNWTQLDATDAVTSVNSQVGNVVLDADDIDDTSTTHKFVTSTDLTKLSNLSGTNTGDQTSIVGITGTTAEFNTALTDGDFATLAGSEALTNKSVNGVTLTTGGSSTAYLSADGTYTTPAGGGGGFDTTQWYSLTGSYASTSTFTFTGGSDSIAARIVGCLFTCTDSGGSTRRIGHVKSASNSAGTVTVTVVTNSDLASGDINFKVAPHIKLPAKGDFKYITTVPGEQVADASNPQGMYYRIPYDAYLLPVNSFVKTAAAGAGAACAWNVYKGATNLFTSAQDMTTSSTFDEKRPDTNTISAGDILSVRVTSSAGATNKASDLQIEMYVVPQILFTTAI